MQSLINGLDRVGQMICKRIDNRLCLFSILTCNKLINTRSNILLLLHKGHKQVLAWEFLCIAFCIETILHIIMFNGGKGINCAESTVMISEDKTIW